MRAAVQMGLPTMEECALTFDRNWQPCRHTLERVKSYFSGFQANGRQIFARRRHAAGKIGISVRTLARYLRHLSEVGWMVTIARKARTAIRQVLHVVASSPVPSPVPSNKVTSEATPKTHTTEVLSLTRSTVREKSAPVDHFDEYARVFAASGKPLSRNDWDKACRLWVSFDGLEPEGWQQAAVRDAFEVCRNATAARFVPYPVNHLLAKPWTRIAMERTLQPEGKAAGIFRRVAERIARRSV